MQSENINIFWSYLIIEELIRCGIDYFCISPGSRSAPLTAAAARHPQARKKIFYDERAAAYHALGYARACGKPAALICTSGTAPANYLPAVIEARNERIPMIIISADRPAELRQTQANQTVEQDNLYGNNVKWHFTMPTPTEEIPPKMVLTTVDLMAAKAVEGEKGAVHLNCMFREPLEPKDSPLNREYAAQLGERFKTGLPYTRYFGSPRSINNAAVEKIADIIKKNGRGAVIIGRLPAGNDVKAVKALLDKLQWPVFADITSGCRYIDEPYMIRYYELLLSDSRFKPDTIIQLGAQFTSKRVLKMISKVNPADYIVIEESSERIDAEHTVSMRVAADVGRFSAALAARLPEGGGGGGNWLSRVKEIEEVVARLTERELAQDADFSEAAVSDLISRHILEKNALFLSNSMPVRDMNLFAAVNDALKYTGANRGASGIDGIIASASGFACGHKRTTVLLTGDLAFLHDLNSLHLIKRNKFPVIIVLLNNQGGGIFRFLPVSQYDEIFTDYFLTPHNYTFKPAAEQFELPYYFVEDKARFIEAFNKAQRENESAVIEVKTDSQINYDFHDRLGWLIRDRLK